jgi:gluconolactonase
MYWAEGPAWNGWGNYLIWSDIPNDVQYRWLNDDGHVSVLRKPCNYSNGNTFDLTGRQISFEHYPPKVRRYEPDGTQTVLAESFDGKSLNGPNDGVIHPNGDLWFTDPGYGGLSDYEGRAANTGSVQPHQKEAIYRINMKSGAVHKVSDESSDTGGSHYGTQAASVIRVWDVIDESRLTNGRVFTSMQMEMDGKVKTGFADGIRCDIDGFIWAGAGWVGAGYDGVHVFDPDGERVAQILLPEICANVCFGGPLRNRLFMTSSQSLYSVYTNTKGAHFC